MNVITLDDLIAICPCPASKVGTLVRFEGPLNAACEEFDITTETRQAAFLAQIAHESAGFSRLAENLNYSADGLLATFPKYFPSPATAADYARQPERIANRVYANRMGNGDEASGDGWRYRGMGLIQTTGRTNQIACATALHVPAEEIGAYLQTPIGAARSAAFFWSSHGLSELADAGEFEKIVRKINGGITGLADRLAYWERAKVALA